MIKSVENVFTYTQFEEYIEHIIKLAKRHHLLEEAFGVDIMDAAVDGYIALIADMFPENEEYYECDYREYWSKWTDIAECAILSFVYGVVDYVHDGDVVAPYNHELLHIVSAEDKVNGDSKDYAIPINSAEDLWKICTGEIPVRERFS